MFNGNNTSGKEFEVIDEDGDVLGAFEDITDAVACGRAAPWYAGDVRVRRDIAIQARRRAADLAYRRADNAAILAGTWGL